MLNVYAKLVNIYVKSVKIVVNQLKSLLVIGLKRMIPSQWVPQINVMVWWVTRNEHARVIHLTGKQDTAGEQRGGGWRCWVEEVQAGYCLQSN